MEGNNPVVTGPVGYGNDTSAALGTGLLAAAALKGGNGYAGYDLDGCIMNTVSDLRHDVQEGRADIKESEAEIRHDIGATRETVKDAECNIRHDVLRAESDIRRDVAKTEADLNKELGNLKFQLHDNISNLGQNVNNRFGLVDVAIVRAEYESKLATQAAIKEINEKIDREADRTVSKLEKESDRTNDKVQHLQEKLEECCCEIRESFAELGTAGVTAELARANQEISLLKIEALTNKK